jgi:hypothetical protein
VLCGTIEAAGFPVKKLWMETALPGMKYCCFDDENGNKFHLA